MAFNRPTQGLSGGVVSSGEGLSIGLYVDDSQVADFFKDVELTAQALAKAPAVVAGNTYGPPLITLLRMTTPFNKGYRAYGGGHLKNYWREVKFEGAHGTEVQIYNASSRANILAFLELGTRRHIVTPKTAKLLYFRATRGRSKGGIIGVKQFRTGMEGRFFIRAVQDEGNRRLRKFIDDSVANIGKGKK